MALKGINVIEFAGLAPGPFCGKILRDLGARVIRIDRGDPLAPDTLGHGKQSIVVNLKKKEGIELVKKLSSKSDVLIEPFRKGIMEKLGIGPNVLCSSNPKLIYARLTGYGQSGELADRAGHDINYLAYSGLLSQFGRKGENPYAPLNVVADFAGGGFMCAMAILTALYERDTRTKVGKVLDVAMVEGAAYVSSWVYLSRKIPQLGEGERGTKLLDGGFAAYETYKTKDGKYMAIGSLEPQFMALALKGLGLTIEDLNKETFERVFKTKTRNEWDEIFKNVDACISPVLEFDEAVELKHNAERKSFIKLEDGNIMPKMSWLNDLGLKTNSHVLPGLGQNTTEILTEFGYASETIQKLIDDGVVAQGAQSSHASSTCMTGARKH